jgi:hypothetical protein
MPGAPTFSVSAPAGDYAAPGVSMGTNATSSNGAPSHTIFLVWVVLVGVVLPVAILGGLKMGGFSFVFKGR